ncbi:hypothetical protein M758_UG000600 [Ceratodon purpureus]|nr:hypothetical protein M758_UG000600 [Ceratodon purpureus]
MVFKLSCQQPHLLRPLLSVCHTINRKSVVILPLLQWCVHRVSSSSDCHQIFSRRHNVNSDIVPRNSLTRNSIYDIHWINVGRWPSPGRLFIIHQIIRVIVAENYDVIWFDR